MTNSSAVNYENFVKIMAFPFQFVCLLIETIEFWYKLKPKIVKMTNLSSLAVPDVDMMPTAGATSDDKVGTMTTLWF